MVYKTFLSTVQNQLQARLGPEYAVQVRQIRKNNGLVLDGLCIGRILENISPTIYLNSYFERYQNGMKLEEILDDITTVYEENSSIPKLTLDNLMLFDQVKDKIVFKLIHTASNEALLAQIPHVPLLDLSVIFYLFLEEKEHSQMTALIHHEHRTAWNLTTEALFELAKHNAPLLLPAEIKTMKDVMTEIAMENLGDDYSDDLMDNLIEDHETQPPLYVLSNRIGINGACCLLYDGQLKNFAALMCEDLVILPSSIHEVLLIPDNGTLSYEDLKDMVKSVNENEVSTEDRLSDEIYLYSRKKDHICLYSTASDQVETKNP